jgi:O-antigen ligase
MSVTAIFYLIIYSAGLFKALAGKPVWGLYTYFLCFYFHAPTQWWGQSLPNVRWALLAALVTLVALLIHPPKRGFRFFEFKENILISVLGAYIVLQSTFALNPQIHAEYTFLFLKFILFIFLVQNTVWTRTDITRLIWANLFGGAFLAYLGMSMHNGGRLEGIGTPGMESANQLGQHFALLIFMGGYLLLSKFRPSHIYVVFTLCLCLMAMFLTESRAVLASVAATAVLAIIFVPRGSAKKFGVFAVLALFAGSLLMGPQIIERFSSMKKDDLGGSQDTSADSRMIIIDAQIEMSKNRLLLGYGHRGTLLLSPMYIPQEYHAQGTGHRASHNLFMSMLVDHGLFGLIVYFSIVILCVSRIFMVKRKPEGVSLPMQEEYALLGHIQTGLILALCCYIISGMGSNNKKLEGDIWMFAMVPIVGARMKRIESKSNRNIEKELATNVN